MNGPLPRLSSKGVFTQTLEKFFDEFGILDLHDVEKLRMDVFSPRGQDALVRDLLYESVLQRVSAGREHLRLVKQVRSLQSAHHILERSAVESRDPSQQVQGNITADNSGSLQDVPFVL